MRVGGKSDVDSLWDTEVPWEHLERLCMLLRAWSLCIGRCCQRDLQSVVASDCLFAQRVVWWRRPIFSSLEMCAWLPHVCMFHPHPSTLSRPHTMPTAPLHPSSSCLTLLCVPARRWLSARREPARALVSRVESLPVHTQTHGGQSGPFDLSTWYPPPKEVDEKTPKRVVQSHGRSHRGMLWQFHAGRRDSGSHASRLVVGLRNWRVSALKCIMHSRCEALFSNPSSKRRVNFLRSRGSELICFL